MANQSAFTSLRQEPLQSRVQDNIAKVLTPISKNLNGTPIMGAPPPAWISPVLLNVWANFGAPYAVAGYHLDALRYVHIKGRVKNTSGAGSSAVIFTLPLGYRPMETHRISALGDGVTPNALVIKSDGTITPASAIGAGNSIDLEVTFLQEA